MAPADVSARPSAVINADCTGRSRALSCRTMSTHVPTDFRSGLPLSKAQRRRLVVIKFRQTDEKKFRSLNVPRRMTEPCRDLSGIGS